MVDCPSTGSGRTAKYLNFCVPYPFVVSLSNHEWIFSQLPFFKGGLESASEFLEELHTQDVRQYHRYGFTLVEVILAMAIFSLIATILYGGLYLSRRAVAKATLSAEAAQRERMLGSFLSSYVHSTYPYRTSTQDPSIYFYGEESRIAFVSAMSRGLGGRGLAKITIQWDGQEGDPLTLEEEMPFRLGEQQEGSGYRNRIVLYPAVDGLQIEYLPPDGDEGDWVERWDGAERKALPRAIRVRLRAPGGTKKQWVVPIMMKALVR